MQGVAHKAGDMTTSYTPYGFAGRNILTKLLTLLLTVNTEMYADGSKTPPKATLIPVGYWKSPSLRWRLRGDKSGHDCLHKVVESDFFSGFLRGLDSYYDVLICFSSRHNTLGFWGNDQQLSFLGIQGHNLHTIKKSHILSELVGNKQVGSACI